MKLIIVNADVQTSTPMLITPSQVSDPKFSNASMMFFPLSLEALISPGQNKKFHLIENDCVPTHLTCIIGNVTLLKTIGFLLQQKHPLFAKLESLAYLVPSEFEDERPLKGFLSSEM
jgi:hypothetical protein